MYNIGDAHMKKIIYRSFREQLVYCHGKSVCKYFIINCVIKQGFCHSKKCYKERRSIHEKL